MAAPDLVNLSGLMDDAKCFALVRQHRWPEGVRCPACASSAVIRDGCDDRQCTALGSLDNRLPYAARLKVCSSHAARASSGLRWPFFSISHSAL